ncbi:hypothetical protein PTKIN_Ptkin04bG0129300 [Pterospermum kingtungense]
MNSSSSLLNITILVVDDDSTSLAIISAMLKEWRYEVATVKNSIDALTTLRAHPTGIDLVVTDLHMPEMNGIELQKQINREFKLPVIIMSSDDKESVMLKSLAGGAVFFMVKPVNPEDLKNVWQYAIAAKKGKSIAIEEIGSIEGEGGLSSSAGKLSKGEIISAASSVNDETKNAKRGSKRKKGKNDREEETASRRKKAKVVWTNSLHNLFLEAIRHIGMERAVPKKILEHMNVQCLTRENVASHLQKYRIFLKRIAEKSCFTSKALAERVLKSSFASGHPLLLKTAQEYARFQGLQHMRGLPYQPGYGWSVSTHNAASLGSLLFPNQNASSSNSLHPHRYGQSCLLGNQANYKQQVCGNTNQGNRLGYANRSNMSLNGALPGGLFNASNGLMNVTDLMRIYQQQTQARPDFYNAGSSQFRFGSPGLHASTSTLGTGNIRSHSTSYPTLDSSCINNNSYSGIRLTSNGLLVGMGQTFLNGGHGTMNGFSNQNMNVATMRNETFPFMQAQGGLSSTGLDGANQVSSAYTASNQQGNTLMLTGLGNRGHYTSDNMMNINAANPDNITLPQQPGDDYLSDLLLDSSNNYQFPNQQQDGGDGFQNPEFGSCSLLPEIYPTLDELLNFDFSESLSLEETVPESDEQALGKASPLFSCDS